MHAPSDWNRIGERLSAVYRWIQETDTRDYRIPSEVRGNLTALIQFLFEEEYTHREEHDRIAAMIARDGRVPEFLSGGERLFIGFRIHCALDFIGMLFPPESSASPFRRLPLTWTEPRAVKWLLVDLWHRRYDHWLKAAAAGMAGYFPFYGITPAID